jgi:hypothetical protein
MTRVFADRPLRPFGVADHWGSHRAIGLIQGFFRRENNMTDHSFGSPAMSSRASTHTRARTRTPAQVASLVVGIAFLLVGILGFIPGVTENFDDMTFAGQESGAELLGVFQVSVLHNLVHVLFGVVGIAAATRHSSSRSFLIVGGIVYLALWIYGLAVDPESDANFVPVNDADDWLHLGLGAGMLVLGLALGRTRDVGDRTAHRVS